MEADLGSYIEQHKRAYYEAVELARRVQDFLDYTGPDRTGYAERLAVSLGVSPQTLYRYTQSVQEAGVWARKLEEADGHGPGLFPGAGAVPEAPGEGHVPQPDGGAEGHHPEHLV